MAAKPGPPIGAKSRKEKSPQQPSYHREAEEKKKPFRIANIGRFGSGEGKASCFTAAKVRSTGNRHRSI
jgi:hypothetical protein